MTDIILNPMQLINDGVDNTKYLKYIIDCALNEYIEFGTHVILIDGKKTTLWLTHDLLVRNRNKDPQQQRIEVLAKNPWRIQDGNRYYESYGVLVPEDNYRFKTKPLGKSRVVYTIPRPPNIDQHDLNTNSSYNSIYRLLHSKNPVLGFNHIFLTMRKPNGLNLRQIILQAELNPDFLSTDMRMTITSALLSAFRTQIYENGLIHNDINPENIFIDLSTMDVTFFNLDSALVNTRQEMEYWCDNGNYLLAPEVLSDGVTSTKADVFSLGHCIAELWGDTSSYSFPTDNNSISKWLQLLRTRRWMDLFRGMNLRKDLQIDVQLFIEHLTAFNPEDRLDIDGAIELWRNINNNHTQSPNAHSESCLFEDLSYLSWFKNPRESLSSIEQHQEPPFHGDDLDAHVRERRASFS